MTRCHIIDIAGRQASYMRAWRTAHITTPLEQSTTLLYKLIFGGKPQQQNIECVSITKQLLSNQARRNSVCLQDTNTLEFQCTKFTNNYTITRMYKESRKYFQDLQQANMLTHYFA